LPHEYTLVGIAEELPTCGSLRQTHVLQALLLCLSNTRRIKRVAQDQDPIAQLTSHAAQSLSYNLKPNSASSHDAVLAEKALEVLKCLVVGFSALLDDTDLISVAAYVDSDDTWTTEQAAASARDILHHAFAKSDDIKYVFIVSTLLQNFIRPIFSRTTSSRITSSGRKAYYANDNQEDGIGRELVTGSVNDMKPWKGVQLHAITVFAWAVDESDEVIIGKNWPLFTPVLLALLDDTESKFKRRGLCALQNFLLKCPARALNDTGLGEVFEQSIFPSLLSLPTLTTESESLQLLEPAFDALIRLADAQFPDKKNIAQRNRLLTRLLREGIFAGYWHATEYPRIVELFGRKTVPIIQHLGTFTIPHL
ncbi:hypothetical protein CCHL11_01111, partial [Colletotrichum chlorophyti]